MVSLIEAGLTNELVLDRANELEDLFRKIFFEKERFESTACFGSVMGALP